jgi:hypothetical protein
MKRIFASIVLGVFIISGIRGLLFEKHMYSFLSTYFLSREFLKKQYTKVKETISGIEDKADRRSFWKILVMSKKEMDEKAKPLLFFLNQIRTKFHYAKVKQALVQSEVDEYFDLNRLTFDELDKCSLSNFDWFSVCKKYKEYFRFTEAKLKYEYYRYQVENPNSAEKIFEKSTNSLEKAALDIVNEKRDVKKNLIDASTQYEPQDSGKDFNNSILIKSPSEIKNSEPKIKNPNEEISTNPEVFEVKLDPENFEDKKAFVNPSRDIINPENSPEVNGLVTSPKKNQESQFFQNRANRDSSISNEERQYSLIKAKPLKRIVYNIAPSGNNGQIKKNRKPQNQNLKPVQLTINDRNTHISPPPSFNLNINPHLPENSRIFSPGKPEKSEQNEDLKNKTLREAQQGKLKTRFVNDQNSQGRTEQRAQLKIDIFPAPSTALLLI